MESAALKQNKEVSLNMHLARTVGKSLNLVSQATQFKTSWSHVGRAQQGTKTSRLVLWGL